jgi:small subunit ribosomal protein S8e
MISDRPGGSAPPTVTYIKTLRFRLAMAIIQARSRRKATGGRYKSTLTKRKHMTGGLPTLTRLADAKATVVKTKGGGAKIKLMGAKAANVLDPKSRKLAVLQIKNVVENPANRYYVRRNIITKGTIIETEHGRARVTSRPGQDGVVNAVLL